MTNAAPIAPLKPSQSLGYLEAGQVLECTSDLPPFVAGRAYVVRPFNITVRRTVKRPAVSGPAHEHTLTGRDLGIAVTDDAGKDRLFVDRRHIGQGISIVDTTSGRPMRPHFDMDALTQHFNVPVPPDLAQLNPSLYQWHIQFLHEFERMCGNGFTFKEFQLDSLARMAIPDGAILAAMPGLGKSCMGIAWLLLKVGINPHANGTLLPSEPVLIIAPGGLRQQMVADYQSLFGPAMPPVTHISSQSIFAKLLASNGGHLAPGFYFSSYEEVSLNKFQSLPQVPEEDLPANMAKAYTDYFGVETLEECRRISGEAAVGLGEERSGVRCVYKPALAELLKDRFSAIVLDEATKIKAENSIVGMGIRSLRPRYRAVCTGTPQKNLLADILYLAAWSCAAIDEPTDRWEHNNISEFKKEFNVMALDKTQEERARLSPGRLSTKVRSIKRLGIPVAEVSNIQNLWRTLAPVVLRLRKSDIGEEIVSKTYRTIRVPFGVEQAKVYEHHLAVPMYDQRGQSSVIARITNLRKCAAAPTAESLGKVRSTMPFTPKVHATLEIVRAVLRRQEQLVLFAPFHDCLDLLSGYLVESGIPHDVLDGRLSPTKRAVLAMRFKAGLAGGANPVLVAGIRACAEGYSWALANNVLLYAEDYALDLMRQAVDRVHRLNSPKPVNVYSIVVNGSIECKMAAMHEEKANAADIALDGAPAVFATEEMGMEDLLEIARTEFNQDGAVAESVCLEAWPALRQSLAAAWAAQQIQIVGRAS